LKGIQTSRTGGSDKALWSVWLLTCCSRICCTVWQ